MPGLVGLVTCMPPARAESELWQMLGVMCHEPFYSTGTWSDGEMGIYVGWTTHQGSFGDAGPLRTETGDAVLLFSGEEYSAEDAIPRLKARGHRLGDGEAAYLVHLYEDDPAFPAGLNGLFHGVLVDRRRGRVLLFNDRYGMHRLYTHQSSGAVYFAAEAKALLAVRPALRRIDPRGLAETVTLGSALEHRTLFEGIRVLPAASLWRFEDGRLRARTAYFQPSEWEEQPLLEREAFYRRTREVFTGNLPRYFGGRQRIGMSLTGGLDTRMIMAWQRCPPGALPCYSWGGTARVSRDVAVAREVACTCRQPHQVIAVGHELLSRFAYYADRAVFLSDGSADVSLAPDLYLHQRARAIAPVRMTGLYGGEVLRRGGSFTPAVPSPSSFRRDLQPYLAQALRAGEALSRGSPRPFDAVRRVLSPLVGSLSLERTQLTVRTPFLDNELVQTALRAPESAGIGNAVSLRLITEGNPALGRIPTDRGLGGRGALSATAHVFQDLLFKAEYAYDAGMPRWLARADRLARPLHPERLLLGTHRFLHFRLWYRDQLAAYVRDVLLDPKSLSRGYIDRTAVERMVRGHVRGDGNHTTAIHTLLTLELVHRNFIDGPPTAAGACSSAPAQA
jgi:asparagine synthase (glutamine-hydrolysing)